MKEFETIAAVATSLGEGGIAIIRISGSQVEEIIRSIFRKKNGEKIKLLKTHTIQYGFIVDQKTEEILDEVLISFMKGPKSFTAEDVIEINCHGGVIATNKILEEVVKAGARIAEPGEFTKRAFLNGRIDLSQAEAVIDIIRAKTEASMKAAVMQSEGRISREISLIRRNLLEVIAHIEATVDFPEDDLEEITSEKATENLEQVLSNIKTLLSTADEGKILREGISVVIVGKPNVGKSSLLNALLMEKRAIVTEVAGTTRDVIEEYINVEGVPVKIVDTAGIRETNDIVEKIGVEKSREKINEADLIILMLDSSMKLENEDKEIFDYIKDKKYIILLNKSDLDVRITKEEISSLNADYIIEISAKEGIGIDKVKKCIKELFFKGELNPSDILITSVRHKEALFKAQKSCEAAVTALRNTAAIDLASIDVRNAWTYLGEITGETLEEDIIDKIFSEFCIGK